MPMVSGTMRIIVSKPHKVVRMIVSHPNLYAVVAYLQ